MDERRPTTDERRSEAPVGRRLTAELRRLRERADPAWQRARQQMAPAWERTRERLDPRLVALIERIGPTRLALAGGALLVLLIFSLLAPSDRSADPFEAPGAALDLILKLLAVLALIYVSLTALKRYGFGGTQPRPDGLLQVLDSTTLAPNRSVYVVRVGSKRLVLGVTTNQIITLAELGPDDEPPAVEEASSVPDEVTVAPVESLHGGPNGAAEAHHLAARPDAAMPLEGERRLDA